MQELSSTLCLYSNTLQSLPPALLGTRWHRTQALFEERVSGEELLKALKAEREPRMTSKLFVHNIYDTCLRQVRSSWLHSNVLCSTSRLHTDRELACMFVLCWRA